MALAAEYGFYYRMPDEEEEWQTMAPEVDTSWRDIVRPILEVLLETERVGSPPFSSFFLFSFE